MKFKSLTGATVNLRNPRRFAIKWGEKSRSKFQFSVKEFLQPYWRTDMVFEELKIVGTLLSLDFYNASKKIAVEVQGRQHTEYVKFFHGNRLSYLDQLKRDDKKLRFCEANGITLVEIYPSDVVNEELFARFDVFL